MDANLRRRYEFFRRHGGGWAGHAAEGALRMARAERMAERIGQCASWEPDEGFDWSEMEEAGGGEEVWCASVWPPRSCEDGEPRWGRDMGDHTTVCGVVDPTPEYRRVLEAELHDERLDKDGWTQEDRRMDTQEEHRQIARLVSIHGGLAPEDAMRLGAARLDEAARHLGDAARAMRKDDCRGAARGLGSALVGIGAADALVDVVQGEGDASALKATAERVRRRTGRFQSLFLRYCATRIPNRSFAVRRHRPRGGLLEF